MVEDEVNMAVRSLQNDCATGPDCINSELFKYAKDIVTKPIAHIINVAFEQHRPIETLSEVITITLSKLKKPACPTANLRPIVVFNSITKILLIKQTTSSAPIRAAFNEEEECSGQTLFGHKACWSP